jgi:hypothetical protein
LLTAARSNLTFCCLQPMRRARQISLIIGTSLLTFFLAAAFVKLKHRGFHRNHPTPWETLLSFENQDLGNLRPDAARRLQNAIDTMTGPVPPNSWPYEPRLFRTIGTTKNETRYILVEEQPLISIPGESRLRVHVFDTYGQLLSGAEFSAGYRTILTGMSIRKISTFEHDALIVHGEYCLGGHPSHQYYVLVGTQLILAYLEMDRRFDQNDYLNTHMTVGPKMPQRSADEWEAALNSNDTAEVTSALIWLGGRHWKDQAPPYDEDKIEAEKVSTLLVRDSVKKRLNDLAQSNDFWVQVAAKRVVDPNAFDR